VVVKDVAVVEDTNKNLGSLKIYGYYLKGKF
jgi:hypothetical protein